MTHYDLNEYETYVMNDSHPPVLSTPKYKVLILGYGRHGKDTVAEYLTNKYDYTYNSSSEFCAEHVVFPVLGPIYNYINAMDCFADRANHRAEWFNLISEYCGTDAARLGKEIFGVSDVYCGLRSKRELHSLKNNRVYDFSIWVDRSDHLPPENKSSNNIEQWMADYTIDNNGTLDELYRNVDDLMNNWIG